MRIVFEQRAWDDYLFWQSTDRKILARLNSLIEEAARTPFAGRGKPEPLRGQLSGWWSRRIDQRRRLVYRPSHDGLFIAQCRFHY